MGYRLTVLMVYMVDADLAKEMLRVKDCWSFAMKRSWVWRTHDLKRKSRGKYHTVWVEIKQTNFTLVRKSERKYL